MKKKTNISEYIGVFLCVLIIIISVVFVYKYHQGNNSEMHVFLDAKDKGDCRVLIGDVLLNVIFVDDTQSHWNESSIEKFKKEQILQMNTLLNESGRYGVNLSFHYNYMYCQVEDVVSMDDYDGWATKVLKALDLPKEKKVIETLKDMYIVDEVAVIFVLNKSGRSFAIKSSKESEFEYAVLYENAGISHELLHIFGAVDYYYPKDVKKIADEYLGENIMSDSENMHIDPFTAYLIGWTETLTAEAQKFVDATKWITYKQFKDTLKEETKTGQGSIRYGEGTYTGALVEGMPHGYGIYIADNGETYEGEWEHGVKNGYGTMKWNNGDIYEGEWKYGAANGYGTMKWNTEGASYTGYWLNWVREGEGTYTFPDGTICTGIWKNNELVD